MKKTVITIIFIISTVVCLSIGLIFKTSLTVLGHVHTDDFSLHTTSLDIKQGDKIQIEFRAYENNLGSVSLQLRNYNTNEKRDDNRILFRIKEKGSNNWQTAHKYYGSQFHDLDYFPFGFSPIANSRGKEYIVEIISLDGTSQSKLSLKKSYPEFISYYQFDKSVLFTPTSAGFYLIQKILFALSIPDYLVIAIVCYLPLLFILFMFSTGNYLYKFLHRKLLFRNKTYKRITIEEILPVILKSKTVIPLLLVMFLDTILAKTSYNFVSYMVMLFVGICLVLKQTTSMFLYYAAFFFSLLVIIFSIVNMVDSAEKMAGWVIWILLVTIVYDMLWKKDFK